MRICLLLIKFGLPGLVLAGIIIAFPPTTQPAQAACPSTGKIKIFNGFLSAAQDTPPSFSVDPDNPNILCLTDADDAVIPQFSFPTYTEHLSFYFDRATLPAAQEVVLVGSQTQGSTTSPIDLSASAPGDMLYHVTGSLTVNSNITINKTGVVFIDGDLLINILDAAPNNKLTHTSNSAGLVFVVGGNVYIDGGVSQVDAVIVTHNAFCSSSSGSLPTPTCDTVNNPLTINGSVILLNNPPNPIPTPGDPNFKRNNNSNDLNSPAETINYQSKYLVILKDIFSRDLTIWSEIE